MTDFLETLFYYLQIPMLKKHKNMFELKQCHAFLMKYNFVIQLALTYIPNPVLKNLIKFHI